VKRAAAGSAIFSVSRSADWCCSTLRRHLPILAGGGASLEALKGNRKGQYSIRVNDQYRICFAWSDGKASGVEIVDYH
jgi:plasmid maintenance system killer protein